MGAAMAECSDSPLLGVPVVPLVRIMIDECLLALAAGDLLGLPRDP
jgi:hypothetical protein